MKLFSVIGIVFFTLMLSACGFHLQGQMQLAKPLKRMYLQSSDPYGYLARSLQSYLKMSKVQLVASPQEAETILVIMQDQTTEDLLSVSSTQQTRQYHLKTTVIFQITDSAGKVILPAQMLQEARVITIQSNQILGTSNEANLYYQQMRRSLAYGIMNRISSQQVTTMLSNFAASQHLP
ncbi:MAG: hypothetical protein H0W64_01485 [Gammaproteobacteria bacterium]|nr:hypothetical protein [Gammaproteobacteria bacterium]